MKDTGANLNVLIVEDNPDDALLVLNELKRGGFNPAYKIVDTKMSFEAELPKGWDLILADYSLPRFSGEAALSSLNKSGQDIPLIVISGSITEEIAVSLLRSGARDFITKNNLSRLLPAVQRELNEATLRKAQTLLSERLREKEEQSDSFFNSANEAFILLDKNLRFIQVNPVLEHLVGQKNEELIGKKLSDVFVKFEEMGRLSRYRNVLKTGTHVTILSERTYTPALGERVVNIYAFKVGEGLGLIINDVTDLSRYEKRLEALHEHAIKLAVAQSLEDISRISLDVMVDILNFKFMSFLRVQEPIIFGIESRGAPLAGFKLSLNGKGITVKAANTQESVLVNDLRKSPDYVLGSSVSLSELAVPVIVEGKTVAVLNAESDNENAFSEQDQRLLEILSTHVASAIHRIESQLLLSDSEQLTQVIMNEITDGVYIAGLDDQIIEVNQAIPRILGYERSELLEKKISDIETPKYYVNFPKLRENLKKNGRNLFESEAIAKNGEIIPFEISTRLITYKGKQAVIGVARDLRERRKDEERLRESEEIYRTILENAPDPVSITINAKIVYANPSRVKLAGASSLCELIGKDVYDFVLKDDVPLLREWDFYSVKEGESPKSLEFRIISGSGKYLNVEAISTPIKYRGQNAVLNIIHDITQRTLFEERLSSLHEYARNLAMADTIKDASRVVGEAVQGMLETSFGSIGIVVGKMLRFEHVYGVDWDVGGEMPIKGPGITTRAVRTGETQLIDDTSTDPDYFLTESSIQTPRSEVAVPIKVDGKVVAVLNVENPQLNAYTWDDVKILEMLGNHFATAIQRINVIEGIKASEEKYRNLFEGVNDAVFIHGQDGRFIEVNEVACKRLGYTREELLKLRFIDIEYKLDPDFLSKLRKTINESGHVTFETIHLSKTGEPIDTEINAQTISLSGIPATLSTCRDIRERKRMEKGLAALHAVVSLLSKVDTVSEIWDITLSTLETILGQHWANINVVQGNFLTFVESVGASPPMKIKNLTLDGPGITVRAAKTGKTQLIQDVLNDPDYVASYTEDGVTYPTRSELVVPVLLDGKSYAVINLESKHPNDFSTDDQRLIEILAGHVGEAIKRIQSMEELVIGEEQLATLHKFTNRLAEAKTFDDAAAVAADSIKTLLNTSTGSLSFVEGGSLHHKYVYGAQFVEEFVQPLDGPGITVRAVVTGEPQLIPDVRKDAGFQNPEGVPLTTLSELAVPVKLEGRVVAVINAENSEIEAYTVRDLRILQILAMHLSSAFARINENESKARYRSRLEALHKLVTQLDTAQTTTDVATLTYDIIQSLTTTTYARLGLIEGDELHFLDIPNVNRHMKRLPLNGRGLTVKAARERQTIIVQDVKNDPDYVKGTLNAQSELVIPIYTANRVIGVLNINSTLKNAFTPDDVKLDETIAMHISSTLERIQMDAERLESRLKIQKKEYEAEQAKELERMKTRFISTATHEIRTPLTSIKGYTELIQSELKQGNLETTKRYFDVVERNVGRLVNLTDDLLDTQRIDEKRMVLNPIIYNVGTLVKDLKAEMTPLLQRKSQTLTITNKHQGNIYGDPNRLMQVLVNLITNASKFSPPKTTIHLSIEKGEGKILFSVQDHGVGLDAEDLPKLFKPFPAIKVEGNPEGTGLGLSICRGIVEMHGGKIWAESKGLGKGTKFSFTIPEVGKNEE